jgi:hypothetical protein
VRGLMKKKSQSVDMVEKEERLTKIQALNIYRAFKKANPKAKIEIRRLKHELLIGLSRHDRVSGIWFLNVYKKVIEMRSKNISLEALIEGYNTEDKEIIARKLVAYYSNYGIATGVILGSSGGLFGFITASYSTFGEIACLVYFQLSLIYDLSVLYERPIDKANNLEIYRILRNSFGISEKDLINGKVDELVDKGDKLIKEKLSKNDIQVLQGILKNLGVAIYFKAVKNLKAKSIPLFSAVLGMLACLTSDYEAVKALGKRSVKVYSSFV